MIRMSKSSKKTKSILFFLFSFLVVSCSLFGSVPEKPFVVVIPSYKNADWYQKNLDSVFYQNYSNYRVVYVDDCSPDRTADLVSRYVLDHGQSERFTLVRNIERKLKAFNFYHAIHQLCDDEEIVVELDGDDWLASPDVLSILNEVYLDPNIWMTYGSYTSTRPFKNCCGEYPQRVIDQNAYRRFGFRTGIPEIFHVYWKTGHLRTFYAWLFKRIDVEDFKLDGEFVSMAVDQCYMYPLLELSGGRFKYIRDILYVYNRENVLNDWDVHGDNLAQMARRIVSKKSYNKIETWLGYP